MPEYFTLTEFRALPEMSNTTKFPDARVEAAAGNIVAIIEREVGVPFIPRTVTKTFDGNNLGTLLLGYYVRSVVEVKVDGVVVTDEVSAPDGILRRYATSSYSPILWPMGLDNIEVTYTWGYSATPPSDIKEAAMRATRAYLLETRDDSGVLDRRSSITNELGTTVYVTAGAKQPTGYPQVDAVILGWKTRLDLSGFL